MMHNIYQKFLLQLSLEGVLIAVSSKNSIENVNHALRELKLLFPPDRFVTIEANWTSKSISINRICKKLNLLYDSTVFIDDNKIEIEEVKMNCPEVSCIKFPSSINELDEFLFNIRNFFYSSKIVTNIEDRLNSYKSKHIFNLDEETQNNNNKKYLEYLKKLNMYVSLGFVKEKEKDRVHYREVNKMMKQNPIINCIYIGYFIRTAWVYFTCIFRVLYYIYNPGV
jgi:FkbH-like protein